MKKAAIAFFIILILINLKISQGQTITVSLQQGLNNYKGNMNVQIHSLNLTGNQRTPLNKIFLNKNEKRALIKFDTTQIPGNAYVTGAKLKIQVISRYNSYPTNLQLFKITKDWSPEYTSWYYAQKNIFWGKPGVEDVFEDVSKSPVAQKYIDTSYQTVEFDVTSVVREWIRYPETNKGLLLISNSTSGVTYVIAGDNYSPASLRPILIINYTISDGNDFPPRIKSIKPEHKSFVKDTIQITPEIEDDKGIKEVQYYLDEKYIGSSFEPPFSKEINTLNYNVGSHSVKIKVIDTSENSIEKQIILYFYRMNDEILTIAHITDTHIGEPNKEYIYEQRLKTAISDINNVIKPAVVIDTGDTVTGATPQNFQKYMSIISTSKTPVKTIPGNHDWELPLNYLTYVGPSKILFSIENYKFIGYRTGELDENWVRENLNKNENVVIFSHYPIRLPSSMYQNSFYIMPENEKSILRSIAKDYNVSVFLSGHVHDPFALQDSSGLIDISGPATGQKSSIEVITFDNGVVSSNVLILEETSGLVKWPFIIITHPQQYYLDGGIKEISGKTKIRAKIFDKSNIVEVKLKIDDGNYLPMQKSKSNIWEYEWDTAFVSNGIHKITVYAKNDQGKSNNATINVKINYSNLQPTTVTTTATTVTTTTATLQPTTVTTTATTVTTTTATLQPTTTVTPTTISGYSLITLQPSKDSFVYSYYPNQNYGSSDTIYLYNKNSNIISKGLIQFDLSQIPKNAKINSAKFYITTKSWSSQANIQLYELKQQWEEKTVTWSNSPQADSTPFVKHNLYFGTNEIDIKKLVEKWVSDPSTNNGFLIISEKMDYSTINFYSKEYSDKNKIPIIKINYSEN
jgi:predicted phosphodiesterase